MLLNAWLDNMHLHVLHLIRFEEEARCTCKRKDCSLVSAWKRSLINDLYWCGSSSEKAMETSRWPNGTQLPTTFRITTTTRTNSFHDASMVDWLVVKENRSGWSQVGSGTSEHVYCIQSLTTTITSTGTGLWESAENNHQHISKERCEKTFFRYADQLCRSAP